jgi:N-acetylmuramoyl-L-alanine amidase
MFRKSVVFAFLLLFLAALCAHDVPAVSTGLIGSAATEPGGESAIEPGSYAATGPVTVYGGEASMEPGADTPLPLSGRVVILDAGHGAGNSPAFAGYVEHVAMLRLALKIKPLLEYHGATVHLTRPTPADVPLPVRTAMINIWALEAIKGARESELPQDGPAADAIVEIDGLLGIMQSIIDDPENNGGVYMNSPFTPERGIHPDLERVFELQDDPEISGRFLSISLHSNATGRPVNTSTNGAGVFHISVTHKNTQNYYTGYTYEEQSRSFGDVLLEHIHAAGINKRKVTIGNYFMIREHNVPGVLAENGFHTNARDRANLSCDRFLDGLALAYLDAIMVYFDGVPLPDALPPPLYADGQGDAA